MTDRLTSQFLVGALIRRAQSAGGFATVLRKGETMSGTILVQVVERGRNLGLFERMTGLDGQANLVGVGPQNLDDSSALTQYLERRLRVDRDIWFVELDVAQGEQLAAELLCAG